MFGRRAIDFLRDECQERRVRAVVEGLGWGRMLSRFMPKRGMRSFHAPVPQLRPSPSAPVSSLRFSDLFLLWFYSQGFSMNPDPVSTWNDLAEMRADRVSMRPEPVLRRNGAF